MKKTEEKKLLAKISKNLVAYSKIPVITTALLADYYGTTPDIITQNFRRNKEHFAEIKHYFKLEGEALKEFKATLPDEGYLVEKFAPALYLWTKRGAIRHAKILNTDKAWEVFDILEEFYFDHEKFQWNKARQSAKDATRRMTDAIRDILIPLAIKQGMNPEKAHHFYNNYNRLINKLIGTKSDSRSLLTEKQLFEVEKMSNIASVLIERDVAKEIDYHDIYFDVRDYLKDYVRISML
mgnify:CR=1 FL=1